MQRGHTRIDQAKLRFQQGNGIHVRHLDLNVIKYVLQSYPLRSLFIP
jgi:hypothetical protein